jgi:hypothetical protein
MGRGARPTVRWKHDRIRRKKLRDKRHASGAGRTATVDATATATAATPPGPRPA